MHNTSTSIHNVAIVKIYDPVDWEGINGKYQTQDICFYDKKGNRIFDVAAYSHGEKFEQQNSTRKTVTIGDKTYYEDELAEALNNIKEVK